MERARRKTLRDFYRLPPDTRAELIDGEIVMAPAPGFPHERVSRELYAVLDRYERRKGGEVAYAPVDVILPSGGAVQPDLLYIRPSRTSMISDRAVRGLPDLIVEIVSPGSVRRDRLVKVRLYARNRVREYWIVDPASRTIHVFAWRHGRFDTVAILEEKDRLVSPTLKDLAFPVRRIFRRI